MDYPARDGHPKAHPQDAALQTYRGHHVLRTLMRARFSPMHSTGQAFIYTGSFNGSMHIYGACRVGAMVPASTGAVCECMRDASIRLMPGKSTRVSGACGPQQQLCLWRAGVVDGSVTEAAASISVITMLAASLGQQPTVGPSSRFQLRATGWLDSCQHPVSSAVLASASGAHCQTST